MLDVIKPTAKVLLNGALAMLPKSAQLKYKEYHELRYWRGVAATMAGNTAQQAHERAHYEHFFTTFFGLTKQDYAGKRVMDVGCGPCGSLEWADNALQRVGVDPLADAYRKLVADDRQQMTYVAAPSEKIPFADGHFDIVTTFNSLDHVDDVDATIAELKRVCSPTGTILVIVEFGHAPTPTEPHWLDESIAEKFGPEFEAHDIRVFGVRADHNLYASMLDNVPHETGEEGIIAFRLERA
ncbi:MAG TPA: class I SAM-dependent methyltransferase [Rhizomicrobium sp.]|jgi:SAM-dependent methyltransferase|nr:class I SAM-dependent methyltransferase [Rhizomicrobium sp.]